MPLTSDSMIGLIFSSWCMCVGVCECVCVCAPVYAHVRVSDKQGQASSDLFLIALYRGCVSVINKSIV